MKSTITTIACITALLTAVYFIAKPEPNNKPAGVKIDFASIDGCQYIITPSAGGSMIIHKGNCTNTFHNK